MKKSILIPVLAISLLVVASGATIGMIYLFSPSPDSELEVVSVTTQSSTDQVTVVLKCEDNETGNHHQHQNRFRRQFAYMHQIQFNNSGTSEIMHQEQMQNQWRHRVQAGKTFSYQFHVEGLEAGQMLQLKITYNNGKTLMYQFEVQN